METTTKKPKIEAIYPLTTMQHGLLFHHLSTKDDQGFLMVECTLNGKLDTILLKEAWNLATKRHEILRTSVHWKNIERPVLLVRPEKEIEWTFLDWSVHDTTYQEKLLKDYKKEQKEIGVNFEKNPLSKISVIQKTADSYYFLWQCHHLLLDGWSSTIILKDAFSFYDDLFLGKTTSLPAIPSYKSYRNWVQNVSEEDPKLFWKETFRNYNSNTIFHTVNTHEKVLTTFSEAFSVEISAQLKTLAKHYKVTLNTVCQGIWSLLLAKCFNTNDVVFGTTVSGRSIPFPNIELMSGMFANVLPVRAVFDNLKSFQENLKKLQLQQQKARNYEYSKLNDVVSWGQLPEDKPLFDSLFVFENFPWETIKSGEISIEGFKSGITTTYPITIIFTIEEQIKVDLIVDTTIIQNNFISWVTNNISNIVNLIVEEKDINVSQIIEKIVDVPAAFQQKQIKDNNKQDVFQQKENTYTAPRNQVELTLVEIWEQLFGINYISITDSFFQLGGKSLLSVKMFALIKAKLGVKLPPTTLLESPTIKELSEIIQKKGSKSTTEWKYLVPIKTKGNKVPLFCIHAGGGHVFFYKSLADAIDKERPVYALQPVGIFGEGNMHTSIKQMAIDYADEIQSLQPKGTLNIVVYCFSTAVGLEMASYLKTLGRATNVIVADTIAEHRLLLNKERFLIRSSAFFKRFFSNPFRALKEMIGYRVFFYVRPIQIKLFGNEAAKNTEKMRQHLVGLFNAYSWGKQIESVSLVLTEKEDKRYNEEIIRSWKPLLKNTPKVVVTKGNHSTFFEAPDVKHTAKAMNSIIVEE